MLVISRNDFKTLDCAAWALKKFTALHLATDLLDLLSVERVFALANFKTVVLRRIVAGSDLNAAVDIEMKQGKIEQWRRAHADIVDLQAGRDESGDHRLGIKIRCRPAVAPHSHTGAALIGDGRAMHLAEQQRELLVKIDFGQTANVIFAKHDRIHLFLSREFCRAKRAARTIASVILESSALSLPAIS